MVVLCHGTVALIGTSIAALLHFSNGPFSGKCGPFQWLGGPLRRHWRRTRDAIQGSREDHDTRTVSTSPARLVVLVVVISLLLLPEAVYDKAGVGTQHRRLARHGVQREALHAQALPNQRNRNVPSWGAEFQGIACR